MKRQDHLPVIGLIPLVDEKRESLWMLPGYMDGVRAAGGLAVMFPAEDDPVRLGALCAVCDGFLFTGGHDVDPSVYHAERVAECGPASKVRDAMETIVLKTALSQGKPCLGICRGLQLINAALGGTLWQDLPTQRPSPVEHRMRPPYNRVQHEVHLLPDTPLRGLLKRERLGVNSCHHQGVRALAPSLQAMALADDGLVEALYAPGAPFLWAVQWHPEFSWKDDAAAQAVFEAFIKACLA